MLLLTLVSNANLHTQHGRVAGRPTNTISQIGTGFQGLVTLHSLSGGRDSGYVPSPSSFHSFTSSSDEDESVDNLPERPRPGATPPITIPSSRLLPALRQQISRCSRQEASPEAIQDSTSIIRGRSKSCPAFSRAPALPRLQVPHRLAVTPVPAYGSTCFMPAASTNGQCLLLPPDKTANIIQDARDLIEEGEFSLLVALPLLYFQSSWDHVLKIP